MLLHKWPRREEACVSATELATRPGKDHARWAGAKFGYDGWKARRTGGTFSSNQRANYDSALRLDDDNLTVYNNLEPACDLLLTVMHAWVDAITMPCVVLSVRPTLLLPKPWGCPVVIAKSASRQAIAQGQPETDELGCAFTTQQSRQTQRSL